MLSFCCICRSSFWLLRKAFSVSSSSTFFHSSLLAFFSSWFCFLAEETNDCSASSYLPSSPRLQSWAALQRLKTDRFQRSVKNNEFPHLLVKPDALSIQDVIHFHHCYLLLLLGASKHQLPQSWVILDVRASALGSGFFDNWPGIAEKTLANFHWNGNLSISSHSNFSLKSKRSTTIRHFSESTEHRLQVQKI